MKRRRLFAVLACATIFAATAAIVEAKLSSRSKSVQVSALQPGSVAAKCPPGSEAVAGGFASPGFNAAFGPGPSILEFGSERINDRTWQTSGRNYGESASGKLVAYAYCDKHEPGLIVKSKTRTVPPASAGRAVAKCPRGSEAVSGGFADPDASADGESATYPFTSKRVGDRKWKVQAANNDSDAPRKLSAFASCDKREPGLRAKSKSKRIHKEVESSLAPKCRHGDQVVSGGYASHVTHTPTSIKAAFSVASKRQGARTWRVSAFGSGGSAKLTAFAYCTT